MGFWIRVGNELIHRDTLFRFFNETNFVNAFNISGVFGQSFAPVVVPECYNANVFDSVNNVKVFVRYYSYLHVP